MYASSRSAGLLDAGTGQRVRAAMGAAGVPDWIAPSAEALGGANNRFGRSVERRVSWLATDGERETGCVAVTTTRQVHRLHHQHARPPHPRVLCSRNEGRAERQCAGLLNRGRDLGDIATAAALMTWPVSAGSAWHARRANPPVTPAQPGSTATISSILPMECPGRGHRHSSTEIRLREAGHRRAQRNEVWCHLVCYDVPIHERRRWPPWPTTGG